MAVSYLEKLNEKINALELGSSDDIFLECKQFLSGAALYSTGQICATLSSGGFAVRLPKPVRQQLLNLYSEEATPQDQLATENEAFVTLPPSVVHDNQMLKSLLELSINSQNFEKLIP